MNLKKIYLETKGTSSFFIVLVLGVVAIKLFYDTMKLLRPVLFFIFGLYERKVLEGYKYINFIVFILSLYIFIRSLKYFREEKKMYKLIILLNIFLSILFLITYAFAIKKVGDYYFLTEMSLYDSQISNEGYEIYLLFVNNLYTIFSIFSYFIIGFLCRKYLKNKQMQK